MDAARTASAQPLGHAVGKMLQIADAARSNHRNFHGIGHGAGQRQIESVLGPVTVHAGQQDFAGPSVSPFSPIRWHQPVSLRPPCVKTFQRPGVALASMATTMHWEPPWRGLRNEVRFCTAAVFIETLSAGIEQTPNILDLAHRHRRR